jgi:hypothetical protein
LFDASTDSLRDLTQPGIRDQVVAVVRTSDDLRSLAMSDAREFWDRDDSEAANEKQAFGIRHTGMKILLYFLTAVFGLFGILAVLRTIERLMFGAGLLPAQLPIAFVSFVLAGVCLKKARSGAPEQK